MDDTACLIAGLEMGLWFVEMKDDDEECTGCCDGIVRLMVAVLAERKKGRLMRDLVGLVMLMKKGKGKGGDGVGRWRGHPRPVVDWWAGKGGGGARVAGKGGVDVWNPK
jgi:hypothetical protein